MFGVIYVAATCTCTLVIYKDVLATCMVSKFNCLKRCLLLMLCNLVILPHVKRHNNIIHNKPTYTYI